ncbi:hypothetical protein [Psychromonas ossibalaenae]|uniref:hypothetical protein n=1 Tax=Psychromonas ossibalaenae TaxID=444922 RepID=UPI00036DEBB9|nr:hypothetical protein [Psychromonas ossibalaenae]
MSETAVTRKMNASESEFINSLLQSMPSGRRRLLKAALNTAVFWLLSMLAFGLLWLVLTWAVGLFSTLEIGLNSGYGLWIKYSGVFICAVYALSVTLKWLQQWPDHRAALLRDKAGGVVVDEHYHVAEVKCFKEPQYGGLIYFLHMSDNKVLVVYDYESQTEKGSSFVVKRSLQISRAPDSGYYIEQHFSGAVITSCATFALTIAPDLWPKPDSWCDIDWHELEDKFSTV